MGILAGETQQSCAVSMPKDSKLMHYGILFNIIKGELPQVSHLIIYLCSGLRINDNYSNSIIATVQSNNDRKGQEALPLLMKPTNRVCPFPTD